MVTGRTGGDQPNRAPVGRSVPVRVAFDRAGGTVAGGTVAGRRPTADEG